MTGSSATTQPSEVEEEEEETTHFSTLKNKFKQQSARSVVTSDQHYLSLVHILSCFAHFRCLLQLTICRLGITVIFRIKKAAVNAIPVSVMVILTMYILVAVPLALVNVFNNNLYAGKFGESNTKILRKGIFVF